MWPTLFNHNWSKFLTNTTWACNKKQTSRDPRNANPDFRDFGHKNGDRTWQNRPKSQLLWPRHERAAAMAAANRAATNAFAWVGSKNQPRSGHPADNKNFWGTRPSNLTSVVPGSLSVEHWFYLNSRNRMCSSTPGTCPSASGAFMAIHSATNWEAWRCLPMGRAIRRWPGWDP